MDDNIWSNVSNYSMLIQLNMLKVNVVNLTQISQF